MSPKKQNCIVALLAWLQHIYHKNYFCLLQNLGVYTLRRSCEWFHSITTSLLPQRVEYRPIVPDAQQLVGRRNPVGVGVLGIPEDGVRQPDQADHIAVRFQKRKERKSGRMRAGIFQRHQILTEHARGSSTSQ